MSMLPDFFDDYQIYANSIIVILRLLFFCNEWKVKNEPNFKDMLPTLLELMDSTQTKDLNLENHEEMIVQLNV